MVYSDCCGVIFGSQRDEKNRNVTNTAIVDSHHARGSVKVLTVEDAVHEFRELAEAKGLDVRHEPSRTGATGSTAWLRIGNAQLRLAWGGEEEFLLLQISHGPPDGPQSGWLELFRSKCTRGSFPDADLPEVSFSSSVQYGLELMLPRMSSENT